MFKNIKSALINILKCILIFLASKIVIKSYCEYCSEINPRRALLSYLVLPILPPRPFRDKKRFGNRGAAQEIARAINELGYVVDIININNKSFKPKKKYDIFIGHAGINFEYISKQLPNDTIKIYYSTGPYWKKFNLKEAERFYNLALRKGYFIPPDRAIMNSEDYPIQNADGIITLSNVEDIRPYTNCRKIIKINSAAYPVRWEEWKNRDYDKAKMHFLFFSGNGNVHKGLDLLLEAFIDTDLNLHICQRINPSFEKVYKNELTKYPNIHLYGFIKMRSKQFYMLAQKCNWIISATCAEGQPNSIIECMAHGLVPILPITANIELGDCGILIPDCKINVIREVILNASKLSPDECKERAKKAVEIVNRLYSVEEFRLNFKKAILEILNSN